MAGTALVTGASAGLGVHFAESLAAQGYTLTLTARRAERLETLAAELRDRHGIKVETLPADLAEPDAVATLMAEIARRGLTVDTLINNAGFGASGAFAERDRDRDSLLKMIDVNCRALTELCHAVLPAMVAARSGAILNVASTAAFQPGPGMAVYYATKAYVLSLTEALHEEVRRQGVRVSALCPGPTATEFFDAAGTGENFKLRKLAGDPTKVVRDGLKALDANRAVVISGAMNTVIAQSTRFTPRFLLRRIVAGIQKGR